MLGCLRKQKAPAVLEHQPGQHPKTTCNSVKGHLYCTP
nr:MAG TPA: hypothetical protein [Caudoviricetes sp.]